ncbi:TIGR03560 family F420-dependent LLM class oxidoreductase [Pseudonocardia sp. HH130630-07]|uniref:TIGR03560 family F420-dependent LLM class oxidoreductase n=1 Tax=Pseudonocardia sp. HH130630-07 TaxID=1690815 RepID=UPI000814BBF9|nr:TIGR03560 family F420-dependent LLM class oxidoreductase [Pseudonocardia sp. HH130630-07]ANY10837.1 LLM class F420-dependent oxidoreductase [Pseudonocardia sp. HH130630-07]
MRLAIHLYDYAAAGCPGPIGPALADAARAAEDGGATALTLIDHWMGEPDPTTGAPSRAPVLEGYTTLGYLAHATNRIELGLLVTGVTYREPALLATTVATLDALSGGRAFLGIGASWFAYEHQALGVPFPPTAERFDRVDEAVRICRQMWSDDDGPFHGRHYHLERTVCAAQPLNRTPKVVIAGMGERRTLRLVAELGDACNLFSHGHDEVARKIDVLDRHCTDVGRRPSDVTRTLLFTGDPLADPDGFMRDMAGYAELGIEQVWIGPTGPEPALWVGDATARFVGPLDSL